MARIDSRLTFALLAGTALCAPAAAVELPTGPSVVSGGVAITQPSAGAMSIQQSSANAIVNWQGFSIGAGGRVDISQPSAASAILNRVTGSTPSTIAGQLNANGQVYIVNPNGIAITSSGTVRAAGFVASTLGISDEDFRAGRRTFTGNGASAAVSNAGTIDIASGGYAALIGGRVDNSGTISVPLGKVGLGAGEQATLDFSGDGFLQVAVPSSPDGSDKALIGNSGRIRASGGRVEIQAATAREAARQAINMSGIVQARTISGRSGAIVLGGGEGGGVTVSGRLDASARTGRTGRGDLRRGGSITVTGDTIALKGATLDASGPAGGGRVRIGGDYQGGGTLGRATTTSVDGGTTIKVDATASGGGGSVVIWSDQLTTFAGLLSAKGGPNGGNGGDAEVSGKALLNYTGLADLSAARGLFGTLLLDPYNVTISNNPDANQAGFTPNGNDSNINVTTLTNALNTANVTVNTNGGGAQAGNITVADPVSWAAATTLTLTATNAITINAAIAPSANGNLTLNAQGNIALNAAISAGTFTLSSGNTTGTGAVPAIGTITANGAVTVGTFALNRGNWVQNSAALPAFSAQNFTYAAGNNVGFLRAAGGSGTAADPYQIADVYGLQGIGTSTTLRANSFVLANSVDASGTSGWNAGAGFVPIGGTSAFAGTFDGRNLTIGGLVINRPNTSNVGLFGILSGTISNVAVTNATVSGNQSTGILVGTVNNGATVTAGSSSGSVTGTTYVGGLVGSNLGSTRNSSSSASASGSSNDVGGLAGENDGGTISGSFATGTVSGPAFHVGGLVGHNYSGTIARSYATGNVSTTDSGAGGLVGENDGVITQSFAFGSASAPTQVGGLAGVSSSGATISQSYATGAAIGTGNASSAIGGLVGANSGGISNSYATGPASGASGIGGLVGQQTGGSIATSFATGAVLGPAANTGGLVGTYSGGAIANSYWDTQTTGRATSPGGGTGQTTAQLQAGLPAGFSPAIWGSVAGGSYPYLNWRFPAGVLVVSGRALAADGSDTPIVGGGVGLALGYTGVAQGFTAANGSYYFTVDPVSPAAPIFLTVALNGNPTSFSLADLPSGAAAVTGLDIRPGLTFVRTGLPTFSAVFRAVDPLNDPNGDGLSALNRQIINGQAVTLQSTNGNGFVVDRNYSASRTLTIAGTQPGGLAGPVTILPGQSLRSAGGDVVVATTQFNNNAGASGLQPAGRSLIYTNEFDGFSSGGIPGGSLFGLTFSGNPPSTIAQPGNQFIFSRSAAGEAAVEESTGQDIGLTRAIAVNQPTLSRQLPLVFAAANIYADSLDLTGGGNGGGPSLGVGASGGATSRSGAAATLSFVQRSSAALERALAECERRGATGDAYKGCVGSALERFSQDLDSRILDLPAPLRNVTAVIRQAAQAVRSARTTEEARTAVRAAVGEVRKAIALIRADEPAVARLQVRQGNVIANALQSVDNRLSRAVGL